MKPRPLALNLFSLCYGDKDHPCEHSPARKRELPNLKSNWSRVSEESKPKCMKECLSFIITFIFFPFLLQIRGSLNPRFLSGFLFFVSILDIEYSHFQYIFHILNI